MCHAYQLFKRAGIPESQIITLAVDDIANARENPFPGKMFNKPTAKGVPGVDVYAGCKIDYSGNKVTPTTFTKVLTGDASDLDGGKVLKSTANSRVFVNFVDHGGVDIIGFPKTTMHSKDLVVALQKVRLPSPSERPSPHPPPDAASPPHAPAPLSPNPAQTLNRHRARGPDERQQHVQGARLLPRGVRVGLHVPQAPRQHPHL